MSLKVEYTGHWYLELPKYLAIQDKFSLGEKLTQIEKESKKRFLDMTDEEIYTTMKYLVSTKEYFKDEKMTDEEFKTWKENATRKNTASR